MNPVEEAVLIRKLETITANLRLLEPIAKLELCDYRVDPYRKKATERLLQEVVEAAVDINTHLLVGMGQRAPDSMYASFGMLVDQQILGAELGRLLAASAGLRNRIVHEYDELDDAIILESVGVCLEQYSRYVAAIGQLLDVLPQQP